MASSKSENQRRGVVPKISKLEDSFFKYYFIDGSYRHCLFPSKSTLGNGLPASLILSFSSKGIGCNCFSRVTALISILFSRQQINIEECKQTISDDVIGRSAKEREREGEERVRWLLLYLA